MPELGTSSSRKKFRPFRIYSEQEAKSARRKKRAFVVLVAGIVISIAAAYGYSYYNSFFESTKDAQVATNSSSLVSKVNGKVAKVLVTDSQSVKAGDPLVQIEQQEFERTLEQRQRELDKSEDRLAGGKVHLERLREASGDSDAARKQYDDARAWYLRQQSKTQELRDGVAEAKGQLKDTVIVAPADGHVAQKTVNVGSVVTAGQPVVHFVGVGMPWLVANFKEQQLEKMKIGQRAEIVVPSVGKRFIGQVESVPARSDTPLAKTKLEEFIGRFVKSGAPVSVRIGFDAKSVSKDLNRLVNGSPAELKVYIK